MKLIESSEQLLKLILIEYLPIANRVGTYKKQLKETDTLIKKKVKKGGKNIEAYMYIY